MLYKASCSVNFILLLLLIGRKLGTLHPVVNLAICSVIKLKLIFILLSLYPFLWHIYCSYITNLVHLDWLFIFWYISMHISYQNLHFLSLGRRIQPVYAFLLGYIMFVFSCVCSSKTCMISNTKILKLLSTTQFLKLL